MSAPTRIDYDALAAQHGGSASIDYDALAAQHGGTSAAPKATTPPIPEQTVGHAAKSFMGDLWDSAKGLYKTITAPPQTDAEKFAAVSMPGGGVPLLRVGKGYYDSVRHLLDNAEKAGEAGDTHGVMINSIAAGLPLVGPLAGDLYEQAKSGDTAGAIGKGLSRATQAASMAPEGSVIPNPATALVKGAAPVIAKAQEVSAKVAPEIYRSALKPTTVPAQQANVSAAIDTGLKEGIPVSPKGAEKLGQLVDDLNDKIKTEIGSGSGKTVNKFKVASRLTDTADKFEAQVNPEADAQAIADSGNEFLRNQPNEIPAERAQALKQGTYRILRKKYGQLGDATVEAQKSLARGIKEELVNQFPELQGLNAQESQLLRLDPLLEKAVARIGNHQMMGIGTPIAAGGIKAATGSTGLAAAVGTLKLILDNPVVKSNLAIALNRASKGKVTLSGATARVAAYSAALNSAASGGSRDESDAQSK